MRRRRRGWPNSTATVLPPTWAGDPSDRSRPAVGHGSSRGSLSDDDHRALALWAEACAERVLPLFGSVVPCDARPAEALAACRSWVAGSMGMMATRAAGDRAMGAARPLQGAPRFAAYACGQAAVVAHVPEHDLGAAAYAIKAVRAAAGPAGADAAGRAECRWQRAQVPAHLLELVLEDQARRNDICWGVFGD